jgi:predicted dehydrogenase
VFDIGPYYLSWLATIFGPAERVAAVSRRSRDTRVIAKGPRAGTEFRVEVPTHYSALIEYANGPAATLLLSFESPLPRNGFMEVTGTEATMSLPDPNRFDGEIKIRATGSEDWEVLPVSGASDGRGLGVLDMARVLRRGGLLRAPGELGLHVLETMEAIDQSAADHSFQAVTSAFSLPEPLDAAWDPKASTL